MTDLPITPLQVFWGGFETIDTVSGLADCLVNRWPIGGGGEAYLTALMVCDAVLGDGADDTAEDARAAFISAAHEAGMSTSEDDSGPDF